MGERGGGAAEGGARATRAERPAREMPPASSSGTVDGALAAHSSRICLGRTGGIARRVAGGAGTDARLLARAAATAGRLSGPTPGGRSDQRCGGEGEPRTTQNSA